MGGLAPLWALGELKPRFVCVLGVAFTRVCVLLFVVFFVLGAIPLFVCVGCFLLLRVCVCWCGFAVCLGSFRSRNSTCR